MKHLKQEALSIAGLLAISINASAFNNGDIIGFDPGVKECIFPGICEIIPELEFVTKGSYFALDTNGDGIFQQQERVAIYPGPDGGIVLGALQPGPGIDEPWLFANSLGMHQTTSIPVTQNPDGTLDFSGWEVSFSGTTIPLDNTASATVTCGGSASLCSVNDAYQIDYTSTVGYPFTGLRYQLHLENIENTPSLNVSLSIQGGTTQECSSTGGHDVSATASVNLINGAQLNDIQWTLDGQNVGTGTSFSQFLSLGSHNISVTATSVTGLQDTESANIIITDDTPPVMNASFIDSRTGAEISSIDTKNTSFVGVKLNATDICDSNPSTSGVGGFTLTDGDTLKIQGNLDKVELTTSTLQMSATATDSSGNRTGIQKMLNITP